MFCPVGSRSNSFGAFPPTLFLFARLLPVRPKPRGEGGETPQRIFRAAGPQIERWAGLGFSCKTQTTKVLPIPAGIVLTRKFICFLIK